MLLFILFCLVLYMFAFGKKDKEKLKRTRSKTVRILKYITRIIQAKDKREERDNGK